MTLLLVKRPDIDKVLKAFNVFNKNGKLTVDKFENERNVPQWLTNFWKKHPHWTVH